MNRMDIIFRSTLWLGCIIALFVGQIVHADFTIGTPMNVGAAVNSSANDVTPGVSTDGLCLYFSSDRGGGYGSVDIWMTQRPTPQSPWEAPTNLGPSVNSSALETAPSLSADGLSMFFSDGIRGMNVPPRVGGQGGADLWMTTRVNLSAPWEVPINLGPVVNSQYWEGEPALSSDGLSLYFASDRPGGYGGLDIYMSTRPTKSDAWGTPVNLGPIINGSGFEAGPSISADGRAVFFCRMAGSDDYDLWMTTRRTPASEWEPVVHLGPGINTSGYMAHDWGPEISSDALTLYFSAKRAGGAGGYDLWQAPIIPVGILDSNGNGSVDIGDLVRLIEAWGQDQPLLDIAPAPFGDGTIDREDLEWLMAHWGQPVDDPTLLGHWPLDETAGLVAYDLVGGNNATIIGLPQWRPQDGSIDGALELNGKTFVTAKSALNPATGPFSVLAWVKGGAPGQTVVSQAGGANWLMADAVHGALMTELSKTAQPGNAPSSQMVITDGNWHRIAFTWDGANRRLYVDSVLAAEDVQESLAASSGNLVLGASKNMAPATFWSGLIDDVRIYERAVMP